MTHIASIGTYLPCWGEPQRRLAGDDEDAVTMAVEAGRNAMADGRSADRVVLVSRELPLLEGGSAAVLLAGLGLDPELEVSERLGGAPATFDAITSARPRTLVIGADLSPAGAAAVMTADTGLLVRAVARMTRSLPTQTRDGRGAASDYGDPRLLRERGLLASLRAAGVASPVAAAGVDAKQAAAVSTGQPPNLPTVGSSSAIFLLAALAESGTSGQIVGAEQAVLTGISVDTGLASVHRHEPDARQLPQTTQTQGGDIPISLAAYERAFEPKLRWAAARHPDTAELDFPPRRRLGRDGALKDDYTLVPLPRTGTVYTGVTVHVPVPGLGTPYSLVIVELDEVGVRALAKVTGHEPGTVEIGDRGRMVLRRVALRSGVPDYGYAFHPQEDVRT